MWYLLEVNVLIAASVFAFAAMIVMVLFLIEGVRVLLAARPRIFRKFAIPPRFHEEVRDLAE